VVAEDGPVGAAWLRLLPEHDRGYGFVDAETPELSIGVVPTHRGRGIGSLLLEALAGLARKQRVGVDVGLRGLERSAGTALARRPGDGTDADPSVPVPRGGT